MNCFTSTGSANDGGCNPYPALSDHGTHVAGTIAAAFDGGRVVGVAPDVGIASYNTFELIPGCGVCTYSSSRWMAMMDAARKGYKVINMSLGGTTAIGGQGSNGLATFIAAEKAVANFVLQQGTSLVASTGNAATNLTGTPIHLPGDVRGVINVSAAGARSFPDAPEAQSFDVLTYYSNYGAPTTVTGPGGDCGDDTSCSSAVRPPNFLEYTILSTTVSIDPTCAVTQSCPPSYGYKIGTSMATPHVAGVVALIRDAFPQLNPHQTRARLMQTSENIGSLHEFGHGMPDAEQATASNN